MSAQPEDAETQVVDSMGPQAATHCAKCEAPIVDLGQAFHKGNGIYQCSHCHNVYQMIYRHLGGVSDTVASWSAESQKAFFKECSAKLQVVPVNGRWALVKAQLVTHHTSYRKEQQTTRVSEVFKPLGVWQTEGYDVDLIRQKGQKSTNVVARLILFTSAQMNPLWKVNLCTIGLVFCPFIAINSIYVFT